MTTDLKFYLIQERAKKLVKYTLQNVINSKTGKIFTQKELADELKVGKSLINHIIYGRRSIEFSKIEKIEKITGIEIFSVEDPEILRSIDAFPKTSPAKKVIPDSDDLMDDKLNQTFSFYNKLKKIIKIKIKEKYPQVTVESRNSTQYVSINAFGIQVREAINKENLHLLFFKKLEFSGQPLLKIEYMISDEQLNKSIKVESWFTELKKYHSTDNASVTDFINGKALINKKRPVYKMSELSDSEIANFALLSLAVFEIQLGLY